MDERRDIAVLHLERPSASKPLRLAEDLPEKGSDVITFGSPEDLSFSVSQGIVSGVRNVQELQFLFSEQKKGFWIQTTAPISGGNSGGPLVNLEGEVLGANTFRFVEGQNLNFAISSIDIKDLLDRSSNQLVVSLSPSMLPSPKANHAPGPLDIISYSGTDAGHQWLREIDQMTVRVASTNLRADSPLLVLIRGKVESVLRSVAITPIEEVVPGQPVFLCQLISSRSRTGATILTLYLHVLVRDTENGKPAILLLYEQAHVLSTASRRQIQRSLEEFGDSNRRRLASIRQVTPSDAVDKLRLFDAEERATAKLALVEQLLNQGKMATAIRWLREIRDPNRV